MESLASKKSFCAILSWQVLGHKAVFRDEGLRGGSIGIVREIYRDDIGKGTDYTNYTGVILWGYVGSLPK